MYLLKNGNYVAEYTEEEEMGPGSFGIGIIVEQRFKKRITGTWQLVKSEIHLSNLGVGKPLLVPVQGGQTAFRISFRLNEAINDQNALNKTFVFLNATTDTTFDGIQARQFCGMKN